MRLINVIETHVGRDQSHNGTREITDTLESRGNKEKDSARLIRRRKGGKYTYKTRYHGCIFAQYQEKTSKTTNKRNGGLYVRKLESRTFLRINTGTRLSI